MSGCTSDWERDRFVAVFVDFLVEWLLRISYSGVSLQVSKEGQSDIFHRCDRLSFPFFALLIRLASCLHFVRVIDLQLLFSRIFEPICPMVLLKCLSGRHDKWMVGSGAGLFSLFYEIARTRQRESSQALFWRRMDAFCFLILRRLDMWRQTYWNQEGRLLHRWLCQGNKCDEVPCRCRKLIEFKNVSGWYIETRRAIGSCNAELLIDFVKNCYCHCFTFFWQWHFMFSVYVLQSCWCFCFAGKLTKASNFIQQEGELGVGIKHFTSVYKWNWC